MTTLMPISENLIISTTIFCELNFNQFLSTKEVEHFAHLHFIFTLNLQLFGQFYLRVLSNLTRKMYLTLGHNLNFGSSLGTSTISLITMVCIIKIYTRNYLNRRSGCNLIFDAATSHSYGGRRRFGAAEPFQRSR